jgi:hypothetical protein
MVFQTLLCFEHSGKYCIWSCSHLLAIFLNATNLLNADGGFKLQTSTRRGTKLITGNKKRFKILNFVKENGCINSLFLIALANVFFQNIL